MDKGTRDNSGVLFRESDKKSPNHPDYKGSIRVEGKDFWISGWIKDGKNGKFMGLAVNPKEPMQAPTKASKSIADMDDDVPF